MLCEHLAKGLHRYFGRSELLRVSVRNKWWLAGTVRTPATYDVFILSGSDYMTLQADHFSSSVIKNHECESEPNLYLRILIV